MSAPSMPFPLFTENTWSATPSRTSAVFLRLPLSVSRLLTLLDENGEDDHGLVSPSQFAFKTAYLLVAEAISILGEDVVSSPVVDSQGGIRVTWRRGNKQVKLVCPARKDGPLYIYQTSPAGNSVRNQGVTAAALADRLCWLINCESSAAG